MTSSSIENMMSANDELCRFEGKKKRNTNSKRRVDLELSQVENPADKELADSNCNSSADADYTYDQLVSLFYKQQQQCMNMNPPPQDSKYKLKCPLIQSVGRKSTLWTNFQTICRHLHRKSAHVSSFILSELGTSGSTNGNNGDQLLINSSVSLDTMEKVLIRYTREFVLCPACKSADTLLQKQNMRQGFKVCSTCHVRTPVKLDQNYNKLHW